MQQTKWFDRKFDTNKNQNIFPSTLERLEGTAARLEEKLNGIHEDVLIFQVEKSWSIKENIGHLIDLEPLWQGRFIDIIEGEKLLRETDLNNTKTFEANHNITSIEELLSRFRSIRTNTLEMLVEISDEHFKMFSLHPRLKTPMTIMDLFVFVAEHDDHHLARMSQLIKA